MKKKILIGICLLWLLVPIQTCAQESIMEQFDFREVEQVLDELFPEEKMSFLELLTCLTEGETSDIWEKLATFLWDQMTYELQNSKHALVQILLIAILAALFHNFSGIFQNQHVAELSFYVLYMLLITICLNMMQVLVASVSSGVEKLLRFFQVLGPVYFMGVAITTGSATSIAFYNILLFAIFLVENLVTKVLLPLVQAYVVIRILNDLSKEEYLSKFGDLVHMVTKWILRVLLAGVLGINMIQGMLAPAIDAVKRKAILGGTESIPLIGDAAGGLTEVVLGTAVLIQNGMGIAGVIICLAICIVPTVQMAVITLLYRFAAAIIQPISEKRIVNCVGNMADGANLLLQIILTTCVLFLITIAIVANST